jgi:hypothetical protein
MSMSKLLLDFHGMWITHSAFGGSEKVSYEDLIAKMEEIERFHYAELRRVEEECTPATRADLNDFLRGWKR